MLRSGLVVLGVCMLVVGNPLAACGQSRERPLRVGNINVLLFGVGSSSFEHPNYEAKLFPNIAYQRRVLRRESRFVHLWMRGAINFASDDRKRDASYTVWWPAQDVQQCDPFTETVKEHTSDFAVRGEMLADLLHTAHTALYLGAGFALHYVTFSSDGNTSGFPIFSRSENQFAPSTVVGARLFTARRPYAIYGEMRYGRAYGRTDDIQPLCNKAYLTDQTFGLTGVNALSFEGGLGLHW